MNKSVVIAVLLLIVFSNAFAEDKPKLPISASSKTLGYSPLWVASKLGFFDKQGLDVQLVLVNGADKSTMALMGGIEFPIKVIREQISSAVELVVQQSRLRDGSRKITHVSEVAGYDLAEQKYVVRDLFVRRYHGVDAHNRIVSDLVPTGVIPTFLPQLEEHGVALPAEMRVHAQKGEAA